MTLETARKMVDEGISNTEAEAVVRGGMTICDRKSDGSRKYQWIKVFPTKSDEESSVEMALEKFRNRKQKRPGKKKDESVSREPETSSTPDIPVHKEDKSQPSRASFLERLKKEAKDLWEELDSIVIE